MALPSTNKSSPRQASLPVDARPNFLLLGAGKSGTTTAWRCLDQHPEVFVPDVKEPNFFALHGETIPSDPGPDRMHHYPQSVTDAAAYRALFEDAPEGASARGEASPMYLYDDRAPRRIQALLGADVRLIAFLRQPAERLFSRWQHLLADGHPPTDDIRDALDPTSIWHRRPDLVPEGFYARHLRRYIDRFPRANLRVVLFDDLVDNPVPTMQEVYRFLGVDPTFTPTMARYNASHRVEHPVGAWLFGRQSGAKQVLRRLAPAATKALQQSPVARRLLTWVRRRAGQRDTLSPALRDQLTDALYADDIGQLELLLDRSLNHWR